MVHTCLIGYDLNRPRKESDYPNLFEAIKSCGVWWHYLDSTWIVKTEMTAEQIRDSLQKHIDSGDELLVATMTGEAAWAGLVQQAANWLRTNLV
jgi:hypothetical protein